MSNWWCCCPKDCPDSERDNFDGEDSTDLGSKWLECIGDWSTKSDQLSVSSSGAVAVFLAFPRVRGYGTIDLYDLSPNRVYRLYAGYGTTGNPCATGSGWVCAEYVIDGTGSGARLNLISNTSGSEVVLAFQDIAVPDPGPEFLTLCVGAGRIQASTINTIGPVMDCSPPGGRYWALGTGNNSGEHLFDNMSVVDHYSFNTKCPQCGCGCEGHCLKKTLRYTIINGFGCTQLDGVTGTITWRGFCDWRSSEITGVCLQPVNDTLQVVFRQATDPPLEYAGPTDPGWTGELVRYVDQSIWGESAPLPGSTCFPLYLKFGPFIIPGDPMSDDMCCEEEDHEFFFVITDV